jgi:hypothetical protein
MENSANAPTGHESKVETKSDDLLLHFFATLKDSFPVEIQRESLRITPHGLFVQDRVVSQLVARYQEWFQKHTGDTTPRSEHKCYKRLFGSESPGQKYLLEGKLCLRGLLVECHVQEPQKCRIPYFLSSLVSTDEYLHPSDPALREIAGLEVKPNGSEIEFTYRARQEAVIFSQSHLRAFLELLKHSDDRTVSEDPLSLTAALKIMLGHLDRMHPAKVKLGLLVPQAFPPEKKYQYMLSGTFVFVLDRKRCLTSCYEMRARNMHHFVRNECSHFRDSLKGRRQGAFELFDRRNKHLGCFSIWKGQYTVETHAFLQFLKGLSRTPPQSERFAHFYLVQEALEEFSTLVQTSQPITFQKVASSLDSNRHSKLRLRINEGWIFAFNHQDELVECVARFAKHPPPSGPAGGRRRDTRERQRRSGDRGPGRQQRTPRTAGPKNQRS